MRVRDYQSDDAASVARLFTESIRSTNAKDYSPEQIVAWAPDPPQVEHWRRHLDSLIVFVAEHDSEIAGFITFEPNGHLDALYVHSRFQRQGVGKALCQRVEQDAAMRGVHRLFTEASITARPFFEFAGFRVIAPQTVECRGVLFQNYRMEKSI